MIDNQQVQPVVEYATHFSHTAHNKLNGSEVN